MKTAHKGQEGKTMKVVPLQICCVLLIVGWTVADDFFDDETIDLANDEKDCMPASGGSNRPGTGTRPGRRPGTRPGGTNPRPPGGGVPPGGGDPPSGGLPPGEVPPGGDPPSGGLPPGEVPPGGDPPPPPGFPGRLQRQQQRSNSTSKAGRTGRRRSKKMKKSSLIPPDCQDYHRKLRQELRDVEHEDSDCRGAQDCLKSHVALANRRVQAKDRAGTLCGPILVQLYEQRSEIDDDEEEDESRTSDLRSVTSPS